MFSLQTEICGKQWKTTVNNKTWKEEACEEDFWEFNPPSAWCEDCAWHCVWVEVQLWQESGISTAATVIIPFRLLGSHCGCRKTAPYVLDYSCAPSNSKQMSQNTALSISQDSGKWWITPRQGCGELLLQSYFHAAVLNTWIQVTWQCDMGLKSIRTCVSKWQVWMSQCISSSEEWWCRLPLCRSLKYYNWTWFGSSSVCKDLGWESEGPLL